jgi:hypothetical protein
MYLSVFISVFAIVLALVSSLTGRGLLATCLLAFVAVYNFFNFVYMRKQYNELHGEFHEVETKYVKMLKEKIVVETKLLEILQEQLIVPVKTKRSVGRPRKTK